MSFHFPNKNYRQIKNVLGPMAIALPLIGGVLAGTPAHAQARFSYWNIESDRVFVQENGKTKIKAYHVVLTDLSGRTAPQDGYCPVPPPPSQDGVVPRIYFVSVPDFRLSGCGANFGGFAADVRGMKAVDPNNSKEVGPYPLGDTTINYTIIRQSGVRDISTKFALHRFDANSGAGITAAVSIPDQQFSYPGKEIFDGATVSGTSVQFPAR